jgi:hypothetical protein
MKEEKIRQSRFGKMLHKWKDMGRIQAGGEGTLGRRGWRGLIAS